MYKIKISYTTGYSFHNRNAEDYIDLTWEDLFVAKMNLQFIKEHYQQYKKFNSYSSRVDNEELYDFNKDKTWFVKSDKDKIFYAGHCIKLKTDDGKDFQMSCFWCDYFEGLISAEIEIDNSDLKIEF